MASTFWMRKFEQRNVCIFLSQIKFRKKKQKDLNYKSCACLQNRNGAFVSVCACNLCVSDDFRIKKKWIYVYPKIELFNTIRCFFFRFHINYTLTYIRKYAYIHRFLGVIFSFNEISSNYYFVDVIVI